MKTTAIVFGLLLFAVTAYAGEQKSYRVYDSTQVVIPKYYIKPSANGEYRVYDSSQIVVPKYIIKPNSTGSGYNVYPSGKPVVPLYRISDPTQIPAK